MVLSEISESMVFQPLLKYLILFTTRNVSNVCKHISNICEEEEECNWCVFQRQSKGVVLLEETFKRLDLVEKDYFGLLYTDNETGLTVSNDRVTYSAPLLTYSRPFHFCQSAHGWTLCWCRWLGLLCGISAKLYGALMVILINGTQLDSYATEQGREGRGHTLG